MRKFRWAAVTGLAVMISICGFSCRKTTPPPSEPTPEPTAVPTANPSPTRAPTPTPVPTIGRKGMETARLFNGMTVQSEVVAEQSDAIASSYRDAADAYVLELKVKTKIPRPSRSMEDLAENDSKFPHVLNEGSKLIGNANISSYFEKLYALKTENIHNRLANLDQLVTRHNLYDCETILEIKSGSTGRAALLIQADMDVNTDGSDGDRNVTVDGSSQFFQPQTSYRWRKTTDRPNPFLTPAEKKLAALKSEYSLKGLSAARNAELKEGIEEITRRVNDLKVWSFLVSDSDPFIVLPGFMLKDKNNPFSPSLGDYAVVIHEGRVYPAIVGDAGPSFKMGEASMRLCKELNSKASAISRPVSNLKVTYLVFPGSADPDSSVPDLEKWHARCEELLNEMGGIAPELQHWENLVKPWPTPTPTPTPTPSPSATPESSPSPSVDEPVVVIPVTAPTPVESIKPPDPALEPVVETSTTSPTPATSP